MGMSDSISSVDQDHRKDGDVPLWLDHFVVVHEVGQNSVIVLAEDVPSERRHLCENIPGGGRVLSTGQAGSKLTNWLKKVDVV